jgi:predicted metal-dependent HD superfamily phosphohydrolase
MSAFSFYTINFVTLISLNSIVYDPTTTEVGSNERKSNDIFLEYASDLAVSETLRLDEREISHVSSMILATIHHQLTSSLVHDAGALDDLKFFLDIDMSILAAEETKYDVYAAAIRNEYAHYSELAYCSGRRKVLSDFLRRERIYFSDVFEGSGMEERARSNICREIGRLLASEGFSR